MFLLRNLSDHLLWILLKLVYNDGFIYDESGKINIKLDKETAEKLYNNQKLIIGFRSEDLRISYTNVDNSALGKISSIELIGKDQLVLVKLNDKTEFIVNATNSDEFELFTHVYVEFVVSRIHIFDKETENRIN
ncbi:TOBE domain-containing protein [Mycoplasmopsis cynos]|nr:TOBE domain-containing protein [Mycoplasmopsis cynos]